MNNEQLIKKARKFDMFSPHPHEQKSEYVFTDCQKDTCPNCSKHLILLVHKDFKKGNPAFYICFDCGFIGEVGLGPVPNISG